MPTEKELMLKQADAETTYQKKLTAGTNITIDPVTNVISSAGGGSTVQYTDNTPNGESVGILAINGQSHPIRIPKLAEGSGITITKNITTNVYTISLSGGGGGTTKTYMGETDPDELVGEDGDLYFKYHKITTVIPTELTLPSLPDEATVPFPINNFNSYESFTFYYTDLNREPHSRTVNIGDLVVSDSPADEHPKSSIYTGNSYCFVQATRSVDGEGLVLRVCGNCLYKLEANVTEVDLGIDKSYAKVEDTWLPSGEQVEANPEETSQTPLTKIKIDGVTYYIAAGGSAEIVPLTKAEWDALPASKYTDNILYLITDSFTTDTIITPNPEGEATDTLTKLQIDETIYDLAGGSGASAIEKTQSEYNELTPAQKENGAIYMVQSENGEEKDLAERMSDYTSSSGTVSAYNSKSANFLAWHALASEDSFDARVNGKYWAGIGDGAYLQFDFTKPIMISKIGFASYLASNFKIMYSTDGNEYIYAQNVTREAQSGYICTKTDTTLDNPIRNCVSIRLICDGAEYNIGALHFYGYDSVESVNKIYYMGTEYANTNGGSGGGGEGYTETILWSGSESTDKWVEPIVLNNVNVDEYDALAIQVNVSQHIVSTEQIPIGDASASSIIGLNGFLNTNGENVVGIWLNKGDNLLRIFTATNVTIVLTKVVGIKYGSGGGSSIIPNPEEEPTDTLNSVKIDGTVYNIESSSEGEGVEIYSEDEYIVGKWIDGKKLYQKTYHLAQAITVTGGGTWTDTGIDISDIETLVDSKFSQDIAVWDAINGINDNGVLKATILASGSLTVDTITLRYTKIVETDAPAWGGSVTNNYAGFIDTDNVIDSGTYTGTFTYIATEDCYVNVALINGSNSDAQITIDGAVVNYTWSTNVITNYQTLPLKKGQTLVATSSAGNALDYTVYGVSYSSGGSSSGSKIEYSTEEKEVGTWIDGSKIYQKTFVLSSFTSGTITINASDLNIKNLVDANGEADFIQNDEIVESLKFPHYISGQANSTIRMAFGNIQILHTGLNEYTNGYVTIQYTKTTD